MALILSIDTSIDMANICLAKDGVVIGSETNGEPKGHGAFLQTAINTLLAKTETEIANLDAISVANGPGSYTGLRVGLASAKGLCFALNKPLVLVNTLEMLAHATLRRAIINEMDTARSLFCPLIDARRMEVFTATYDDGMECLVQPRALVLDFRSFDEQLEKGKIFFSGNGYPKFKNVSTSSNAYFLDLLNEDKIDALVTISEEFFSNKKIDNLAYCEPFYVKDVFFAEKSKL